MPIASVITINRNAKSARTDLGIAGKELRRLDGKFAEDNNLLISEKKRPELTLIAGPVSIGAIVKQPASPF
jgi:hypothetical protein